MPRYKKYSSKGNEPTTLIAFNMVCHGLSQNANNHQLNSYRDVIVGKPYSEVCDNIVVKMIYEPYAIYRRDRLKFKNGRMDVPDTPISMYLNLKKISLYSEMVQTFVEHNHISHVDIARKGSIHKSLELTAIPSITSIHPPLTHLHKLELKSDIGLPNGTRQCTLGPIL